MNMFKKLVIVAVFLCNATVAEEGMRVGIRFGYSIQSVVYKMGTLGLRAGIETDIPIGSVFISPEVDFLYRNNWNATILSRERAVDYTQTEFAVSIPVMIKILQPSSFFAIGVQVDIPIDAKECLGNDCSSMDGNEVPYFPKRADFEIGIILNSGYIITPNLSLDVRYIYGITPHHTYEEPGISGKIKSNPMSSYGFGITYFFL